MTIARFRGARPSPQHKLFGAKPAQIVDSTPAQFAQIPKQLSYWLNNQYGDCVTAEEAFAKACHDPEIFIEDDTVRAWAEAGGFLNGADLITVLDAMVTAGFSQNGLLYDDGPPLSVDYTNAASLHNAISRGPVKIGIAATQLENVVGTTNGWFALGFHQDTNMDHCVSLCGYGSIAYCAEALGVAVPGGVDGTQPGYLLFTWNTIGVIDVPSMLNITSEAWLRAPTTWTRHPVGK